MQDDRELFKLKDIIIILLIAAVVTAGLLVPELTAKEAHVSAKAVIKFEGMRVERVSLKRDGVYEFSKIKGMKFTVENGEIYVSESDCGDMTCMRTGKISRNGEAIICVPNKAAVIIENSTDYDDNLDVILR